MSIARTSEITATSSQSFDAAAREGLERACKTLRNIRSAWIKDQEIMVKDDRIDHYKVTMKVTFVLDD